MRLLAIGDRGPILLEDAVDLAGMMVTLGKAVPPTRWVEEWRIAAEADALANFGM